VETYYGELTRLETVYVVEFYGSPSQWFETIEEAKEWAVNHMEPMAGDCGEPERFWCSIIIYEFKKGVDYHYCESFYLEAEVEEDGTFIRWEED